MPKKPNSLKTTSELTPQQRKFVNIYVSNYGEISKVEAAKQAGYTSSNKYGPTDQASRLLNPDRYPHVVRYFEKRMAQELEREEKDKLLSYKHYARMRDNSEKKGQMTAAITAQYRRDRIDPSCRATMKSGACAVKPESRPTSQVPRTLDY
jgi:phage terminase small subunit